LQKIARSGKEVLWNIVATAIWEGSLYLVWVSIWLPSAGIQTDGRTRDRSASLIPNAAPGFSSWFTWLADETRSRRTRDFPLIREKVKLRPAWRPFVIKFSCYFDRLFREPWASARAKEKYRGRMRDHHSNAALSSALRLMLMGEMRDAKVERFMPSNSAAPPVPETFPFACIKALMMASRSWRFSS
jgi:hypothetical protein